MKDFFKLMLYLTFGYVAIYVGGWLLLAMLPFIYEYWWFFALCGFSIFVAFCIGLYRTYYQRNEQEKNE